MKYEINANKYINTLKEEIQRLTIENLELKTLLMQNFEESNEGELND